MIDQLSVGVVMVVKWSACTPSTPTIRVRILLSSEKVKIEEIDAFNNIFSLIDLKMKYEALVYLK